MSSRCIGGSRLNCRRQAHEDCRSRASLRSSCGEIRITSLHWSWRSHMQQLQRVQLAALRVEAGLAVRAPW